MPITKKSCDLGTLPDADSGRVISTWVIENKQNEKK